jgi:hypothetical protein
MYAELEINLTFEDLNVIFETLLKELNRACTGNENVSIDDVVYEEGHKNDVSLDAILKTKQLSISDVHSVLKLYRLVDKISGHLPDRIWWGSQ